MNEFTKDELMNLYKCIRLTEIDSGECYELDNLKFKLQSMIDNYCEHEYKKTLDKSGMCFIGKCHKCNMSVTWNLLNENK